MKRKILFIFINLFLFIFIFTMTSCNSKNINTINLSCEVVFNYNDNQITKNVDKGKLLTPIEINVINHEFLGWYIDKEFTIPFDFNIPITSSIDLFAKLEEIVPVIITPIDIETSVKDLYDIKEIKDLIDNKEYYNSSFNYYIVTGKYYKNTLATDGSFYLQYNQQKRVLVKNLNDKIVELNPLSGDLITIRGLITYIDGLYILDGEIIKIEQIDHFITVLDKDKNIIIKHNLFDYKYLKDLPIPEIEDYQFIGWYSSNTYISKIKDTYEFKQDIWLYPLYEKIPYYYIDIKIDDEVKTIKTVEKVKVNDLEIPVKDGFIFDGWYLNDELLLGDYMISESCLIRARFKEIKYSYLTYNINDKDINIPFVDQISINDIDDPIKENYTFIGWFFDDKLVNKISNNYIFTASTIIYAKFEKVPYYFIKMIINNNEETVKFLDSISINLLDKPNIEGYNFLGWFYDQSYLNKIPDNCIINEDLIIYAKLEQITYYKVSLVVEDKETIYQVMKSTSLINNNVPDPLKEDYQFIGWYKDKNYLQSFNKIDPIESDIILYAKFIKIEKTVKVTFSIDNIEEIKDIPEGLVIEQLEIPQKDDYCFDGWYINNEYLDKFNPKEIIYDKMIIYGKFIPINYYNISIHILNEITMINKVKEYTILVSLLKPVSIDNYEFKGWYKDELYQNPVLNDDIIESNIHLYCLLDKIEYYDIIINILDKKQELLHVRENTLFAEVLTKPNIDTYYFVGWYLDKNYSQPLNTNSFINENIELYAKMEKIEYFNITIHIFDDILLLENQQKGIVLSSILQIPIYSDYYFKGWFNDIDYLSEIQITDILISDLELYAKMELIPVYNVSLYQKNVLIKELTVKENTTISQIEKLEMKQDEYGIYTFDSWYMNSEFTIKANSTMKIDHNIELHAHYNVKRFHYIKIYYLDTYKRKITLNIDDYKIKDISSTNLKYSDDDYLYTFVKWYFDKDYKIEVPDNFVFSDETYYDLYGYFNKTPYLNIQVNNSNVITNYKVLKGDNPKVLEIPMKEGYQFVNWCFDKECLESISDNYVFEKEIMIYPLFKQRIIVSAVVNNIKDDYYLFSGDSIDLIPIKTLDKKKYIGWFFDDKYSSLIDNGYIFTKSITIYAKYLDLKEFTITTYLDTINSENFNKKTIYKIIEGYTISSLPIPTIPGYTFIAWFYDNNFSKIVEKDLLVDNDIIIYAKYEINLNTMYTVNYFIEDIKDGTYELYKREILKGKTNDKVIYNIIEIPNYITPENGPTPIIKGDGSTQINLYYNRSEYTVKYFVNNELYDESLPSKWGHEINYLTKTLFDEFILIGWYLDEEYKIPNQYTIMPAGGIILYGNIELINEGTTGLNYQLNETNDQYIVVGYNGNEENIIIPNGYKSLPVTAISVGAFKDTNIVSITMSDYITKIEDRAFYNCSYLSNIILSNNIIYIGNEVFGNCLISSIVLPKKIEFLGDNIFVGCSNLERISLDNENNFYTIIDDILYNKNQTKLIYYACKKNDISIVLNNNIKEISSNAFNNVYYLKELTLGSNTLIIRSYAFNNCLNLEKISINEKVNNIEKMFISKCINMKEVKVNTLNNFYCDINGVLFNKTKEILFYYPSLMEENDILLTTTIKEISQGAIQYNNNLTSFIVNENIKKINFYSIIDCPNMVIQINNLNLINTYNDKWFINIKEIKY